MKESRTFYIPGEITDRLKRALNPSCEADCLSEDEKVSLKTDFGDGYVMEVQCHGVPHRKGIIRPAESEAVLYHLGHAVVRSGARDAFEGVWTLPHNFCQFSMIIEEE